MSDSSVLQYTAPSVLPSLASGLEKSVGARGGDESFLAPTARICRGAAAAPGFFAGEWFRRRMLQLGESLFRVAASFTVRRPVPVLPGFSIWWESDACSTPSSGDPHGTPPPPPQISAVPFSECVFQEQSFCSLEDEPTGGVMVAFRNVELYLLDGSATVWQIVFASRFPGRKQGSALCVGLAADLTLKG